MLQVTRLTHKHT